MSTNGTASHFNMLEFEMQSLINDSCLRGESFEDFGGYIYSIL